MGKRANATKTKSTPWRQSAPKKLCLLYILAHLLQGAGKAEVDESQGSGDEEDNQGDRGGQTVVHSPAAFKGQAVGVGNEDVGVARGGLGAHNGRPAPGQEVDHREVVEVKG